MSKGILGRKVGMTQIYDEAGMRFRSRSCKRVPARCSRFEPWSATAMKRCSWALSISPAFSTPQ